MTHKGSPQVCPERNPARYMVFENPSDVGGEVSESSKGKTERWRGRRHCDDRLPIAHEAGTNLGEKAPFLPCDAPFHAKQSLRDRKSTRLNSSHSQISYAVFCLKKKKLI